MHVKNVRGDQRYMMLPAVLVLKLAHQKHAYQLNFDFDHEKYVLQVFQGLKALQALGLKHS